MTSILHRLRGWAAYAEGGPHPNTPAVRNAEAADEIERLREAITRLLDCPVIADGDCGSDMWGCAKTQEAKEFARAALAGEKSRK